MQELDRIKKSYEKRIDSRVIEKYSLFIPGELYMLQSRERETIKLLKSAGVASLSTKKILEIGCGRGGRLADFQRWGANSGNLHGIDLMAEFVDEAKMSYPAYEITQASAHSLPYPDEFFDIVVQSTVFTSIKDAELQQKIANEMVRVLKPSGIVLWYDFRYPNPWNPDVKPVTARRIRELFPHANLCLQSVTLLPPVARWLAKISYLLCDFLEAIPVFRSHYIGVIIKREY